MARTSGTAAHHEHLSSEVVVAVSSDRTFGLVFSAFFALVCLLPRLHGRSPRWWALEISVLFLLIAQFASRLLHPFNLLWAKVAVLLHQIISPVAMALVFYLAFTPMSFVLRLMGKDPLRLQMDPARDSYWLPREPPGPTADTMIRQF
jgi:hypothetical protein